MASSTSPRARGRGEVSSLRTLHTDTREVEHEAMLSRELDQLRAALEVSTSTQSLRLGSANCMWSQVAREELAREKVATAQLATKLDTQEKDLSFKIQAHRLLHSSAPLPLPSPAPPPQVLEEQLEQERRRTTLDFSDRDLKLKSEYERRVQAELRGLRKRYRQEI